MVSTQKTKNDVHVCECESESESESESDFNFRLTWEISKPGHVFTQQNVVPIHTR